MDDLISRAAAIEYLMTNMGWHDEYGYEIDDADEKRAIITDLVNGIPAVDAIRVVRCRDCKYGEPDTNGNGEDMVMCHYKQNPIGFEDWLMPPEWFCADGERRDEDATDRR